MHGEILVDKKKLKAKNKIVKTILIIVGLKNSLIFIFPLFEDFLSFLLSLEEKLVLKCFY